MTRTVAKRKAKEAKPKAKGRAKPARRTAAAEARGGGTAPPAKPSRPTRGTAARPRRGLRWLIGKAVYASLVLGTWAAVAALALVAYYATDLPNPDAAFSETRAPMVSVRAADGSEIARSGDLYGQAVGLSELPRALPAAVLATEDRRFYDHVGVDVVGLARAMWVNLKAGRIRQGGSTLTQQVAKNLFLTSERSVKRKVQELLLAFWLESRFTKDQILEVYLNRVYLGAGAYGVDAAARLYFDRPARDLSVYQSAMLAGLLKAPSRLNPRADAEAADARTRQVLRNMVAAGYLSAADAGRAIEGEAVAAVRAPNAFAKHFSDWALDAMGTHTALGDSDAVLRTTLDPALQREAEAAVGAALSAAKDRAVSQAAVVVLDGSGAVRAMVGGRDYARSPFNRATEARRQPGSAFKPFVYLAGLEAGFRPGDILEDAPVQIGSWRPGNFDGRYRGPVTMTEGLAHSLNTVAVRIARRVGAGAVTSVARRLGAASRLPDDLSIALGTAEVTLVDLAQAYAPFANGGFGVIAHGVHSVLDGHGRTAFERTGEGPGRLVSAANVARMNLMLSAATETGTGKQARPPGAPANAIAGKTGTSQDFRDAWFVGYTTDRVVAVWVGNDDGSPMKGLTGGSVPARIARQVLAAAQGSRPWAPLPGLGGTIDAGDDTGHAVSLPGLLDGVLSLFGTGAGDGPAAGIALPSGD